MSNWARTDWDAYVAAVATQDRALERAALQRFLLGVAYRTEELHAHELTGLLDATDLPGTARAELFDHIEFALGLLAAFGRMLRDDRDGGDGGDGDHLGGFGAGGPETGIGDLVT